MKFINVGYSNLIAGDKILVIGSPASAPVKRLMQDAKNDQRAIDLTCGKKVKSVILMETNHVILSALSPETLGARQGGEKEEKPETEREE